MLGIVSNSVIPSAELGYSKAKLGIQQLSVGGSWYMGIDNILVYNLKDHESAIR